MRHPLKDSKRDYDRDSSEGCEAFWYRIPLGTLIGTAARAVKESGEDSKGILIAGSWIT